jgi:ADP-ribose pyrophosphatase YjhB (NUDIX family)
MTSPDDHALTAEELRTLEAIVAKLSGRGADLPWPLFRFVTEVMATPNVDLLVQDEAKGVLLAWRDDPFGAGWHVPGSIIRHREEVAHRIAACAQDEFGCEVAVADRAVALIQIFDDRGHSLSLCYRATLRGTPGRRVLEADETPEAGDLRWFVAPPARLYPSHLVYRDLLEALGRGDLGEGVALFTQHVGRRDAAQASPEGSIGPDPARGLDGKPGP